MDDNEGTNGKVLGGIALLVVGAILLALAVQNNDKEGANTACALSASGVTAIALGLSHGRAPDAIVVAGGPLSAAACKELVKSLVDEPTTPQTAVVQLGNNNDRQVNLSATDFVAPSASRLRTCFDWISPWAESECLAGRLSPPPF